jgi:protein-L-isoaspartate O-methyltransferase
MSEFEKSGQTPTDDDNNGTGTGYNAALLAARLGAPNVTTVEIDPGLATAARTALDASGCPVTVLTGDGSQSVS